MPPMITYKSRFLVRGEVWFDNNRDPACAVDWIIYRQRSRPVPGARTRHFYTPVVDLSRSHEELLGRLSQDTAYKIRRARERDKIDCECLDAHDPAVMDRFEQMYNQWAALKGLQPLNRARMEGIAAAGLLDMSAARHPQDGVLVYHANYRDSSRAVGVELPSLYPSRSDSAARNLVGRANRYLVWSGILRYKEQGLRYFDFGGWYFGDDPTRLRINDFKRGFGGQIETGYECEQIVTVKGWVVTLATAVLARVGSPRGARSQGPRRREWEASAADTQAGRAPSPAMAATPAPQDSALAK